MRSSSSPATAGPVAAGGPGADAASARAFLTAEWRWLVLLNYVVDPDLLRPWLPAGVELDEWNGHAYVSMVGFRFVDTRLRGLAIPWHRDFDEVNLRFYVRRQTPAGWRRGVVFVKEIVPRPAIALVARLLYGERYVALPMRHAIAATVDPPRRAIDYAWRADGRWHRLWATTRGPGALAEPGSEADFITEHYWGYVTQRGRTVEYPVEHPRWRLWTAAECGLDADVSALYGPAFADSLAIAPVSAYVADGSRVSVGFGRRLS